MAARRAHNPEVAGSSPALAIKTEFCSQNSVFFYDIIIVSLLLNNCLIIEEL